MSADLLALLEKDPAAGILAVADLREQRIGDAQVAGYRGTLPWTHTIDAVPAEVWTVESDDGEVVPSSRLLTMEWPDEAGQALAEHIAAEANPAHALAAVRTWRLIGDALVGGVIDEQSPIAIHVADEARAYLGGAT